MCSNVFRSWKDSIVEEGAVAIKEGAEKEEVHEPRIKCWRGYGVSGGEVRWRSFCNGGGHGLTCI